jgi:glycine hydroxymethyltransferase
LAKKINSAVFPGVQGGPLMHVIAAKAVAFGEALQPSFKAYARQVLSNACAMVAVLADGGLSIVSGGTDSHLALVDLRPLEITGKAAEAALEQVGLTCNKNAIPFDPQKPALTSGIRLGSSAGTSRGFGVQEFQSIGSLILQRLTELAKGDPAKARIDEIGKEVRRLCDAYPIYPSAHA